MADQAPKKPLLLEGPPVQSESAAPLPVVVERVSWVDYLLIGLAVLSLALVIVQEVIPSYWPSQRWILPWLIIADTSLCGVFAVEFLARMRRQPNKWAYTKSRWYDVLGMSDKGGCCRCQPAQTRINLPSSVYAPALLRPASSSTSASARTSRAVTITASRRAAAARRRAHRAGRACDRAGCDSA